MRYVYFIKPIGMDGPIKIGCSYIPDRRRDGLEMWSPFPLEIVLQIAGDHRIERQFHAKFVHLHQHREWFSAAPELLDCIDALKHGDFDLSSLPEPIRLNGMVNGVRRSYQRGPVTELCDRVLSTQEQSGYACPIRHYSAVQDGDHEAIAAIEAYLDDPVAHGVMIHSHRSKVARLMYRPTPSARVA